MNKKIILALAPLLLSQVLIGCLDDDSETNNSSSAVTSSSSSSDPCAGPLAIAIGSDYKTGKLFISGIDSNSTCKASLDIYQDSKVYANGNYAYILERSDASKITKVGLDGKVIYQNGLGSKTNPQDLDFVDDKTALATYFGIGRLVKIDLTNGTVTDSLNLDGYKFNDSTSSPNADDVIIKDDKAYVALQRWSSDYSDVKKGLILKVDIKSMKVEDTLQLQGTNPMQVFNDGGTLFAICHGDYAGAGGTVEKLDFDKHTTTVLNDKIQPKQVVKTKSETWIALDKGWGSVQVFKFDLGTGVLGARLEGVDNAEGGLAASLQSDYLLIGERFTSDKNDNTAGVYIYKNGSKISTLWDKELPPYSIAFRP